MDWELLNDKVLNKVSRYLMFGEMSIDAVQVKQVADCGVDNSRAVELLLANYLDFDETLQKQYLPYMLKRLDRQEYQNNAYYRNIKFKNASKGDWQLKKDIYAPYQIFVQDDFCYDGQKVLPQLGYFEEQFEYPAVYQNGVMWMSVTPNEINTMRQPIERAKGKVLTFGLGMGYFAYMCCLKDEVKSITVVENDSDAISLFKETVLPQFEHKDKIKIVNEDAYVFFDKMRDGEYDYVFVDIYHDAGDGREVYKKFKCKQNKFVCTQFDYWIEKTIKYYL